MTYPRVIFQDEVNNKKFRIVATHENNDIAFNFEISTQNDSTGDPIWTKEKSIFSILNQASPNYERMYLVLKSIIDEKEDFNLIKDLAILE